MGYDVTKSLLLRACYQGRHQERVTTRATRIRVSGVIRRGLGFCPLAVLPARAATVTSSGPLAHAKAVAASGSWFLIQGEP